MSPLSSNVRACHIKAVEDAQATAVALLDLESSDLTLTVQCQCGDEFTLSGYEMLLVRCRFCGSRYAVSPVVQLLEISDEAPL